MTTQAATSIVSAPGMGKRQLLRQQRQHRRVGEVKQSDARREH